MSLWIVWDIATYTCEILAHLTNVSLRRLFHNTEENEGDGNGAAMAEAEAGFEVEPIRLLLLLVGLAPAGPEYTISNAYTAFAIDRSIIFDAKNVVVHSMGQANKDSIGETTGGVSSNYDTNRREK